MSEEKSAFANQKEMQKEIQKKRVDIKKEADERALERASSSSEVKDYNTFMTNQEMMNTKYKASIAGEDITRSSEILKGMEISYDIKQNEFSYSNILNNLRDSENKLSSNADINSTNREWYFNYSTANSDKELHLWYPHTFDKMSEREGVHSVHQLSDLEKYGAYVFQIKYYPQFKNTIINIIHQGLKELTEDIAKDGYKNLFNNVVKNVSAKLGSLGESFTETQKKIMKKATSSKITQQSAKVILEDILTLVGDALKKVASINPQSQFDGQAGLTANIYLPMNRLEIKRNSGIQNTANVTTNIFTNLMKGFSEDAFKMKGMVGTAMDTYKKASGQTMREFKKPRLKSPDLETKTLQWTLIPRTPEEHRHITYIISFFSSLSVPTFEDKDLFFHMPPIITMRAMSSFMNTAESKITYDTTEIMPLREYYLMEFNVKYDFNEDSVMLNEDGVPIGATLEITMMKNELETGKSLFENPYV